MANNNLAGYICMKSHEVTEGEIYYIKKLHKKKLW